MAPSNGIASNGQQVNGSRRAAGKVIPAIPLALSKRSAGPQPKAEIDARAVETSATPTEDVAKNSNATEAVQKVEDVVEPPTEPAQGVVANGSHEEKEEQEQDRDQATKPTVDTQVSRGSAAMDLLNGATPQFTPGEAAVQEPALINGQTETSSPTVIASPVSRRKTADRFDMRHIRTELPPAFIPSAGQHTPHSATSSFTRPYPPPGLSHGHGHPTHPSAGSIVFGGGQDSATSSPAPPLSAGSAYAPPPQAAQPPFFGHAHHPSDSQRMGPPNGYMQQQSPMQRGTRQGFVPGPQPFHPHAHMPGPHPPREPGRPAGPPFTNGHGHALQSRSTSQASSIAYDVQRAGGELQSPIAIEHQADGRIVHHDQKAAFPGQGHLPPQHMGPPPPPNLAHPAFANDHNALAIRDHLYSQFENPELADCHLQISDEAGGRRYFEGHKIILARSSTLLSIIRNSAAPASAALKTQVPVQLEGQHVVEGPFFEALRFLYGGALPDFDPFGNSGGEVSVEARLDLAFKYIATGAWLNLTAFAHRGVEICSSLLHWETIPSTLAFTLDGGLGQMWPIKDGLEDGNEEKNSTCSSDDSFKQPEVGGAPRYDPYSSALLHRALDYMVHQFPPNFYLDQAAPQLASTPRLPIPQPTHESKPSRSDPRLSSIRFGDISAEDGRHHQRPSQATTNISSILLSLPFPLLKFLLEHPILTDRLGPDTVSSIMRQVVGEREVRRQKALLQARTAISDILYWEELVEPFHQNKAGFRLARRRRGINTPPSSNESEQAR